MLQQSDSRAGAANNNPDVLCYYSEKLTLRSRFTGPYLSLLASQRYTLVLAALVGIAVASPPAFAQSTDTSPAGMVAYFATQSECPAGWSPATYLQGRLALGFTNTSTYARGKTVGTALADETPPTHEHGYSLTLTLSEKKMKGGDCGGSNSRGAHKGSYTIAGTTEKSGSNLPLFQILACEKDASNETPPPVDGYGGAALALFNTESCPAHWSAAQGTPSGSKEAVDVNGFFLMPLQSPPQGTVGVMYGTALSNLEVRKHHHQLNSSITLTETQYEAALGLCKDLTGSGQQDFSGPSEPASSNIPYTQLLLCERSSNYSAQNPPQGVPTNIVTFYNTQQCPSGWKPSATGSGRFFVGLPNGGTADQAFGAASPLKAPGDVFTHSHNFTGSVSIPSEDVLLDKGSDSDSYGAAGSYTYNSISVEATLDMPYLVASNCQPCVENDSNPQCDLPPQ